MIGSMLFARKWCRLRSVVTTPGLNDCDNETYSSAWQMNGALIIGKQNNSLIVLVSGKIINISVDFTEHFDFVSFDQSASERVDRQEVFYPNG